MTVQFKPKDQVEAAEPAAAPQDAAQVSGKWNIVRTNHHQERRARFYLQRQGFEVYLPLKLSKRPRHDQTQHHPLFPGYVFVRIGELGARWHAVFSTEGVSQVLTTAQGQPYVLQRGEIEALRAREIGGLIRIVEPKTKRPKPAWAVAGQRVKVNFPHTRDPMHPGGGMIEAVLDEICETSLDANRVAILFKLFERDQRVVVALDGLTPL